MLRGVVVELPTGVKLQSEVILDSGTCWAF